MKQGVIVEIILTPDALALGQNLGGVGVLLRGPVARFLQQRHVDHGRRIALSPGVAIPVPGAAEVAALLEDAHIRDARLLQPGARHQAREAPSDKGKGDVVGLGCPLSLWDVGIRQVVRQGAAREPPILLITIGAQALIPLLPIPFPKGCAIHEGSSPQAVSDPELTRGRRRGREAKARRRCAGPAPPWPVGRCRGSAKGALEDLGAQIARRHPRPQLLLEADYPAPPSPGHPGP